MLLQIAELTLYPECGRAGHIQTQKKNLNAAKFGPSLQPGSLKKANCYVLIACLFVLGKASVNLPKGVEAFFQGVEVGEGRVITSLFYLFYNNTSSSIISLCANQNWACCK